MQRTNSVAHFTVCAWQWSLSLFTWEHRPILLSSVCIIEIITSPADQWHEYDNICCSMALMLFFLVSEFRKPKASSEYVNLFSVIPLVMFVPEKMVLWFLFILLLCHFLLFSNLFLFPCHNQTLFQCSWLSSFWSKRLNLLWMSRTWSSHLQTIGAIALSNFSPSK